MADDIGSRNLRLAMPGNRKGDMTYGDLTALVPWLAIGAALAIMILLLQKGRLPLPARGSQMKRRDWPPARRKASRARSPMSSLMRRSAPR